MKNLDLEKRVKNIEEILTVDNRRETGESYTQQEVERVIASLAMKNLNLKTRVIDGVEYYEDEGIRWPKKDFDEAVANASKKLKDAIDKMCVRKIQNDPL